MKIILVILVLLAVPLVSAELNVSDVPSSICFDLDEGVNAYAAGAVFYQEPWWGFFRIYEDTCLDGVVREMGCVDGNVSVTEYQCANGCTSLYYERITKIFYDNATIWINKDLGYCHGTSGGYHPEGPSRPSVASQTPPPAPEPVPETPMCEVSRR